MKATDIKPCAICGKGVMHSGTPLFYRVKVEPMGVNVRAVQRHAGLEQVFGGGSFGAVLASVMGPSEDIAAPIDDNPPVVMVCQPCALEPRALAFLLERA